MFWNKKNARAKVPDGAPAVALDEQQIAKVAWFERYGMPTINQNRLFVVCMVLGGVCTMQAVALATLYPFVKPIPYMVKVNPASGRVEGAVVKATDMTIGAPEKKYFLGQFGIQLMEIDKSKSEDNFKSLAGMVLGKAAQELNDFRVTTQLFVRLAQTPTLTRVVNIKTVTPLPSGDAALIRVSTDETLDGTQVIHKAWLITAHYRTIPPTKEESIYRNPLGIYVTHFSVQEDSE